MKRRILTALVMAAVLVPLLFLPSLAFSGALLVVLLIASAELFALLRNAYQIPKAAFLYPAGAGGVLYGSWVAFHQQWLDPSILFVTIGIVLLIGLLLITSVRGFHFGAFGEVFAGSLYLSLAFAALSFIHMQGLLVLVYLLLLTLLTDTFAYFSGLAFGRRKLAPAISPKKTIEGAVGGTLIAVTAASAFGFLLGMDLSSSPVFFLAIGVVVSVAAQLGDLVASAIKRFYQVKDFSRLFPGHGGVLDRFDSTLLAALVLTLILVGGGV